MINYKHIKNTGYFCVGCAVIIKEACEIALTHAKAGVDTCIEVGKRANCTEPFHEHHDGCPACDV